MIGWRSRCFLWGLCGLLVICLAGIELPELLTLTNDTSNDFTTTPTPSKASAPVQIHRADTQQHNPGATVLHFGGAYDCFITVPDTKTLRDPRDFLVLHSFWRT